MNIIIENAQFSIFFERDTSIRKKVFSFEDVFCSKYIKPFQLLQVPDEAPQEIPRIQAKSINGHSQIIISQSNLSINTNFDNGWEKDWNKCREYLKNNIELTYTSLNKAGFSVFLYTGLIINLFVKFDNQSQVIEHLNGIFLKKDNTKDLYDINLKFTYKMADKYYINYNFSNSTKYSQKGIIPRFSPVYLDVLAHGLSVNIDVNDRFSFNFMKDYLSNVNEGVILLDILNNIMNNQISDIIQKGDIIYAS